MKRKRGASPEQITALPTHAPLPAFFAMKER